MANSGVLAAIFTPCSSQQEFRDAPVQNEHVDAAADRENEFGLRAVNHEARGALRRAGLEEGREQVVSARTDREDGSDRDIVFEIGRSIERIDRNAERRLGIENFREFRFLRQDGRDGRDPQRAPHHPVGGQIDVLLPVAVGIDAAEPSGNSRQRPVGDEGGKLDRRGSDRLDHSSDRRPVRGLRHRPVEMRTQGHAFVHGRSPVIALFGAIPMRLCWSAVPPANNSPVCQISEIFLSLAEPK